MNQADRAAGGGPGRCHLYLVEDDVALRDMLGGYLQKQGCAVTTMAQAEDMFRGMHAERPDLIILDVGLPGMDGLDACRRLRADGDEVPLILLTARGEEIDRVVGLEMGADDYLSKPFSARELLARVKAILRRAQQTRRGNDRDELSVPIGACVFWPAARSLQRGDETRVLNSVEFAMLAELVQHAGEPVSRERLREVSHAGEGNVMLRAVDAAIMRLRKSLEPDPARHRYIQTVRGRGYAFIP
ncbi:response regulator [Aquabacterium sp.]|uniref:response regulator n=1 Tax=Aquabacterium sp. TaxID=1872578 RepID=UPI0035B3BE42